ncbi:hypothetical protein CBR_g946 [Chara braunii]|uniref:Uncharacterized protein n=1 Tax=Chara braunii TaxID=69332 RepID=A0A388KCP6_CHABU|nr:hypothetical protein CBR_g946 [Chara braunii]|eukprot:GBG67825.1 hypothetical protein CBR_g946 [Chara braunii]
MADTSTLSDAVVLEDVQVQDLERLPPQDMIINLHLKRELIEEGKQRVKALKNQIRWDNVAKDILWIRIRDACWSQMSEHMLILSGIGKRDLTVPSYPLRAWGPKERRQVHVIEFLRGVEAEEMKLRTKNHGVAGIIKRLLFVDMSSKGHASVAATVLLELPVKNTPVLQSDVNSLPTKSSNQEPSGRLSISTVVKGVDLLGNRQEVPGVESTIHDLELDGEEITLMGGREGAGGGGGVSHQSGQSGGGHGEERLVKMDDGRTERRVSTVRPVSSLSAREGSVGEVGSSSIVSKAGGIRRPRTSVEVDVGSKSGGINNELLRGRMSGIGGMLTSAGMVVDAIDEQEEKEGVSREGGGRGGESGGAGKGSRRDSPRMRKAEASGRHDIWDDDEDIVDEVEENANKLYADYRLYCSTRKRTQMILLKDEMHRRRTDFNKECRNTLQKKVSSWDLIAEKEGRIHEIEVAIEDVEKERQAYEQLMVYTKKREEMYLGSTLGGGFSRETGVSSGGELRARKYGGSYGEMQLSESEEPERLLVVEDSEIKADKQLTEEERKKKEKEEAELEMLRKRAEQNQAIKMALTDMMGGTLERKQAGKIELQYDAWMDLPLRQLSDEQVRKMKEFEEKVKPLVNDRIRRRKALEV